MKGKTAIITGSTNGIGLGIAQALAAQGADILLNGFGDADEIAKLQRDIAAEHGVRVSNSDADLSKPSAVSAMVEQAVSELAA